MTTSWLVLPIALSALAFGWGSLVRSIAGWPISRSLLPALGLAAITAAGSLTTASPHTAGLTTPLIVAGGVVGLVHAFASGLLSRPPGWALAAATAVFAGYAAPIVLSGEATFAGYIKLDDTSTWLAITDRMMEHGRSLEGLPPSTYQATLQFNVPDWYPIGVFVPLGVSADLTGEDPAWLIQPYMAWLAAMLSLVLFALSARAVEPPAARAGVAFIAAQPALLVGYYLWGGIKELAASALIALVAALAVGPTETGVSWRGWTPLAIAGVALLAVLTAAGAVWLLPILVGAAFLLAKASGLRSLVRPGLILLGLACGLIPLILAGALVPPTSSPLDSGGELGNLVGPLSYLQAFGIWPVGDFRYSPRAIELVYVAIAVLLAAGAYGVARGPRMEPALLLYVAGAAVGTFVLILIGSPWIDAKAMAAASPAFLLLGLVGCAALIGNGRTLEGCIATAVIVGGVLLSSALAYREVSLAPRDQLGELERIGEEVAGEGPTLMTEFQPYGVRHFLRDAEPEGISELRHRPIPLLDGQLVPTGQTADTDRVALDALLVYRTLVLRRSPIQSRPPSPYDLVSSGEYYEVWQQPVSSGETLVSRLPLGAAGAPSEERAAGRLGVPRCAHVRSLASAAGRDGRLVAAGGSESAVAPLRVGAATPQDAFAATDDGEGLLALDPGLLRTSIRLPGGDGQGLWLGGSVRGSVTASVDGRDVGTVRGHLNYPGQFIELAPGELSAGTREVELRFEGEGLRPGSAGRPLEVGPLVYGSSAGSTTLTTVSPSRATSLCGKPWDWIEVVRPGGP